MAEQTPTRDFSAIPEGASEAPPEPGSDDGFRVGTVLSKGFSVLFRNIVPFGLLALLLTSPSHIYALLIGPDQYVDEFDFDVTAVALGLVNFVLAYLLTAALVYGTVQELRGQRASFGDCLGRGIRLALPLAGLAIVVLVITGIAFLLLIVPGIIVTVMLWVAFPVAVIEKKGLGSIGRSAELTKGYRWKIFGILLIMGAIAIVTAVPLQVLLALSDTVIGVQVVNFVLGAFIFALGSVLSTVGYHDLRTAKEGVDVERIAAALD